MRTGSEPSAIARGSPSVRHRNRRSGSAAFDERVPPDEVALVELDREAETGLERRLLGRDVRAPHAVALLEPERVDRLVAAGDEPVLPTRLPERVPEGETELDRAVQLPAELAHVGDAQREAGHAPDRELLRGHVRERVVRKVGRGERLQDLASAGPPEAEAGERGGDVRDVDGAVIRHVLSEPREVVLAERGPGDDPEPILLESRDGEVALDSSARVEHLGVGDPPHSAGDAVRGQSLEELGGSLTAHLELRERGLVEERCRLATGDMLGADRGRPVLPRPASRPQRLVAACRVRLEPVRALPARLLAEGRAELDEAGIRRRDAQRPARLALVTRVLDVVVGLVDLLRPRDRVLPALVGGAEAARVHVPDVERRRPLDDPLGDELPHPARAGEPVGAEPRRHPEAAHVRRAEDELAVGGERLGTVDQPDDLRVGERGNADDRVLHQLLEPRPVLLEQARVEVRRNPVEAPWRAVALVAAHDEPARLGAEVDEQGGIAHRRHLEREPRRLRDEVLVGHRDDGDVDPGERADLARVHPARVDDDLGLDLAAVRPRPRRRDRL